MNEAVRVSDISGETLSWAKSKVTVHNYYIRISVKCFKVNVEI